MKISSIIHIHLTTEEFQILNKAAQIMDEFTSALSYYISDDIIYDRGVHCMEYLGDIVDNTLSSDIDISTQNFEKEIIK